MNQTFGVGQIYKRTDIHNKYGGQRQGGISTPAKYPFIFLFTGINGERYGYRDGWQGDIFLYTGEGQKGNMEFVSGNRAIRDSSKNGEELHLFKFKKKGFVEYMGQMVCMGYTVRNGPDVERHARELIVFQLKSQS
jgi:5-methylcytosine-specific restriction protein A